MPLEPAAPDFDAQLVSAARTLGLDLSEGQRRRLLAYLALIGRWNQVYNLTALKDPVEMFTHHLLDCLAILPPLDRWAAGRRIRVLDVGSGAGLPGIVLAIARPDWEVTCVDTVAKKVGFLRQAAAELSLPALQAVQGRVEQSGTFGLRKFDLIVSRAFASLHDFTRLSRHALAEGGVWAAMKGHVRPEEQAELDPEIELFHVEQLRVPDLAAIRHLAWLRPAAAPAPHRRQ